MALREEVIKVSLTEQSYHQAGDCLDNITTATMTLTQRSSCLLSLRFLRLPCFFSHVWMFCLQREAEAKLNYYALYQYNADRGQTKTKPNLKVSHELLKGGRSSSSPLTAAETPNALGSHVGLSEGLLRAEPKQAGSNYWCSASI